ncbi:hypothetical protein HDU98_011491 [Podochytrium sp. JEL0797]|nr:hypothetical protein HDU98_011491 [Podochytrium sp. JEL0797]
MQIHFVAVFFACATTLAQVQLPPDDTPAALEQRVPVGGTCGGGIQNAPQCQFNLDCVTPPNLGPGTPGTCALKISGIGGPCNQPFPNSAVCAMGLVCSPPSRDPSTPLTQWTCETRIPARVPVGGSCGGGTQNAGVCEFNLDCVVVAGAPPGAKGVCKVKVSDVGGPCNQPFPNSAVCKSGLVCVESRVVGSGTCAAGYPTMTTTRYGYGPTTSTYDSYYGGNDGGKKGGNDYLYGGKSGVEEKGFTVSLLVSMWVLLI